MTKRINIGDLVRMKTHTTGFVGIVLKRHPETVSPHPAQFGIVWFGGSGKIDWEPEGWLERL